MAATREHLDQAEKTIYAALKAGKPVKEARRLKLPNPCSGSWSLLDFTDRVGRVLDRLVCKGMAEVITSPKDVPTYTLLDLKLELKP